MSAVSGTRFVRADARAKATGQARYAADLVLPGMLHAKLVYPDHPYARIRSLDLRKARALPDVLCAISQDDVPDVRHGPVVKDRTLFATDVVRYEGDPIALVAARSEKAAEEACRLVEVEYEPLEPVLEAEAALAPGAPLLHPEWESYEAWERLVRNGNDCGYSNIVKGDVAQGLAEAEAVVSERYLVDMSHAVPIEPHAVLAEWNGDRVTIWTTSQVPFAARADVAEALAVPERSVRIVVPHLGGGFGGKCDAHFEAHVAAAARAAGRPVRLVLSRREEFLVPDKVRHPMTIELTTGIRADGTISARKARVIMDTGAYASDGPPIGEIATMMAAGPYRIPHLLIEANTVYTNKTPAGSVRAPSGPQVCWAVEQHTDVLAERAGLDPLEFRLRNLVEDGDEGPTGQRFDGVGVKECLRRAAELVGLGGPREPGEGIGLACGWWFSMPGASGAQLRVNADGSATVVTGAQENGSGAVMGLALLAAEELGLDPGAVSLVYQDTDAGPYDGGSSGSQTTFNNGRAVIAAAREVRARLLELASEALEAAPEDLVLADGSVSVVGSPNRAVSIADVAAKAQGDGELLLGRGSSLPPPLPENFGGTACAGRVIFPAFAAPAFFCHAARIRLDRDTGVVRVLRVAAAHDFGRVLNPVGAEGQVEGGVVHAVGIALSEGTRYGDGRQANPHLLDYKLQTSADAPEVVCAFVDAPAPDGGPAGSKGVGEPPIVPTAGAVANAIADASGARVHVLPMSPPRVWAALSGSTS